MKKPKVIILCKDKKDIHKGGNYFYAQIIDTKVIENTHIFEDTLEFLKHNKRRR